MEQRGTLLQVAALDQHTLRPQGMQVYGRCFHALQISDGPVSQDCRCLREVGRNHCRKWEQPAKSRTTVSFASPEAPLENLICSRADCVQIHRFNVGRT